jgi:type I protein arginine methyltransferase
MHQPGRGHGALVWFDRTVADGIKISNEPGAPEMINISDIYGQAFFPWPNSVVLEPGDRVSLRMKADLVKDEYIWQWETNIEAADPERKTKAHFRQSSLLGHALALESLKKREAEWIPTPNEDTRIDAFILSMIDGHTSLREIACALAANFPLRFRRWQDAMSRVGDTTVQ